MKPAITLLVPCYNAAPFLPRFHEAVRALTTPFDRVLCYDDGSTDNTVAVARSCGLEILTGQPNRGVAHARNQLVNAANTEWIHFHDADDLIAPDYVAQLAPWCDARHDVVSCDADWLDETTRALQIAWRYDAPALAKAAYPYLLRHAMGLNSSIGRAANWRAIGGCDTSLKMWEDADIHIRLARAGARFHHVSAVLTWSLRRQESFSHDYVTSWTCRVAALERYATTSDPMHARLLAEEAERAAGALSLLGARAPAERALALCRRLGFIAPLSCHPVVRLLKPFLPAYTLLRWQARRRQR